MYKAMPFRTGAMSAVVAIIIGSALEVIRARATQSDASEHTSAVQLAQSCAAYGPYATIRRANEIAYEARTIGYSTQVFHNGDGYYVRVC